MNTILLACIPLALGVGLLWGFALGCLAPTASRRQVKRAARQKEIKRAARQKAWEKHWVANREAEYAAAFAELSSARMADDTFKQANE
jgi:hypothetical protein